MVISTGIFRNSSLVSCSLMWFIQKECKNGLLHRNSLSRISAITCRALVTSQALLSEKKFKMNPGKIVKDDGTVIRPKTPPKTLIVLLQGSKEVHLPYNDAVKLAEQKNLNLIEVDPPNIKTSFKYYKLVKDSELGSIDLKDNRSTKIISFTTSITDNDLKTKVKHIKRTLDKKKTAICLIKCLTDDNQTAMSNLWERIKQELTRDNEPCSTSLLKCGKKTLSYIIKRENASDESSKINGGVSGSYNKNEAVNGL